jgi:biopolymer transport protein ExbD
MNAAQVRAKARMAMKRREEEIEIEEIEGGELNLVPYLDIITNVVLFLLASVTSGLVLGTINSSLPEYSEGAAPSDGQVDPTEPPLQLTVAVTKDNIQLFSLSGLEGTVDAPKLTIPATEKGKTYDLDKLNVAAAEIVTRRFGNKPPPVLGSDGSVKCILGDKAVEASQCRPPKGGDVFLAVDGDIPYSVVIATMDALRLSKDNVILFPAIIFSSGIQ